MANIHEWPVEHCGALRSFLLSDSGSFRAAAANLNSKFQTTYTRNACIGKAKRLGLTSTRPAASIQRLQARIAREKEPRPPRIRPTVNPAEAAALRCVEVEPRHLTMDDLERGDGLCRFPYGEGPFTFCGLLKTEGSSYCLHHFALTIGIGTESERAATKVAAGVV